jgi:hypothetical protein
MKISALFSGERVLGHLYFVKRLKRQVQNELGGSIGAREEGHYKLHIMGYSKLL